MHKITTMLAAAALCAAAPVSAQSVLTVDASQKGAAIGPLHYGIFFEEINHAGDGGIYAELIRNRSFEDDLETKSVRPRRRGIRLRRRGDERRRAPVRDARAYRSFGRRVLRRR